MKKSWGTMDKINLLYVAHDLDQHIKLKALQYYLVKCSGPKWAKQIETNVKELLNHLWEQYNKLCGVPLSCLDAGVESSSVTSIDVSGDNVEDTLTKTEHWIQFTQYIAEVINNLECMKEVDRYLLDGCEATTKDFDILLWWKVVNAPKYPILADIARDILAIHISTVASEFAFSNRGCILDPFRSSLSPLTVDALICTQD
jgi:hypothetical protein